MRLARFAALALVMMPGSAISQQPPAVAAPTLRDGSHDFDFEFGNWKAHIARRLKPLTGSNKWVEYDGPSVVRPWWGGAANIGELRVSGRLERLRG